MSGISGPVSPRTSFIPLTALAALAILALAACAAAPPPADAAADSGIAAFAAPAQWQAPLPHQGRLDNLAQWWQRLNDPLLVDLIAAAQLQSPDIAQARLRLEQARASRVAAGAALLPTLGGAASVSRGLFDPQALPRPATSWQAGLQTAWEIDVFGGNRAARNAAAYRLGGAGALWHDARVAVAADTAQQTTAWRSCLAQLAVAASDAASRAETSRLTDLTAQAGFTAPATAALARASRAEAANRVTQQRAQCDVQRKALVALTGMTDADLQAKIEQNPMHAVLENSSDALFSIASIPAQVLAQRPDVFNADQQVAAARMDLGSAQADRYPRLSLSGAIGTAGLRAQGVTARFDTWSIGPLAVTVPLFDGGRRTANIETAQVAYSAAASTYRAQVRRAVAEVEQALVNLQATADRTLDAQTAAQGYRTSFDATQARYQSGLASLVELEDSRRTLLAAETTRVGLQGERMAAWIALYRAAGGGWEIQQEMQQAVQQKTQQAGPGSAPATTRNLPTAFVLPTEPAPKLSAATAAPMSSANTDLRP